MSSYHITVSIPLDGTEENLEQVLEALDANPVTRNYEVVDES